MGVHSLNIVDLNNVLHIGTKSSKLGEFNVNGIPTGGIYNFLSLVKKLNILPYQDDVKMIVVCDQGAPYRRRIYPNYKNRAAYRTDKDIILNKAVEFQKELIISFCEAVGIPIVFKEGVEADDLMFNVVLNLVCNTNIDWNKFEVNLHSSDADWLGPLAFTPKIRFFSTNSNSEKLNKINNIYDYINEYRYSPILHYLDKAVNGDTSDSYPGCGKVSLMSNEIVSQITLNNFWNYFAWEILLQSMGLDDEETKSQFRLAFPIYDEQIANSDWFNLISDSKLNIKIFKDFLYSFRINLFNKNFGKLPPFTQDDLEGLSRLKDKYRERYSDVFEYFEKISYIPKISFDDAYKAFGVI